MSTKGYVTLVDVSPARWSEDESRRKVVTPIIGGATRDCVRSADPTFPRLYGSLCGARGLAIYK